MNSGDDFAVAILFLTVVFGFIALAYLMDGMEARIKKLEDRQDKEQP